MILCDVGNTMYHFWVNNKEYKYFLNEQIPLFGEKLYYISVNEPALSKLKIIYDETIDLEPHITFQTTYVGMGLDRKVACLGFNNAVIVDAGSAITVDIMQEGIHQGGFILPGLKKSLDLYPDISSKLQWDFNVKVNLDTIPLNTQDAISYAILKSILTPIEQIAQGKPIIFAGGDGELLSQFIPDSTYKKNLLFDHMKKIIDENERKL